MNRKVSSSLNHFDLCCIASIIHCGFGIFLHKTQQNLLRDTLNSECYPQTISWEYKMEFRNSLMQMFLIQMRITSTLTLACFFFFQANCLGVCCTFSRDCMRQTNKTSSLWQSLVWNLIISDSIKLCPTFSSSSLISVCYYFPLMLNLFYMHFIFDDEPLNASSLSPLCLDRRW